MAGKEWRTVRKGLSVERAFLSEAVRHHSRQVLGRGGKTGQKMNEQEKGENDDRMKIENASTVLFLW
jgi:hypothetical protein